MAKPSRRDFESMAKDSGLDIDVLTRLLRDEAQYWQEQSLEWDRVRVEAGKFQNEAATYAGGVRRTLDALLTRIPEASSILELARQSRGEVTDELKSALEPETARVEEAASPESRMWDRMTNIEALLQALRGAGGTGRVRDLRNELMHHGKLSSHPETASNQVAKIVSRRSDLFRRVERGVIALVVTDEVSTGGNENQ